MAEGIWLALMIGNTRWHWGAFEGDRWLGGWHTPHLTQAQTQLLQRHHFAASVWQQIDGALALPSELAHTVWQALPELWVSSVVEVPLSWLAADANIHPIDTAQVPLHDTYPTLGVDRALALVGAGDTWGWPVLVIDCGTALTFTAGANQRLVGGAILPGLRLQFTALYEKTDRLPAVDLSPDGWPDRWAQDTAGAIASGILYTQLAGIRDFIAAWEADYAPGPVVITGGDSGAIAHWLHQQSPPIAQRVTLDPDLGFWGLRVCRSRELKRA